VRALEAALLDRIRYERLSQAKGREEFVAVLAETAYARFMDGGASDVPQALDRAAGENVAFLSQYALDRWLLDLFRLPAAFRCLKAALKDALAREGSAATTPAELDTATFASRVGEATAAVVADFHKHRDPAAVDVAMDRLQQNLQLETAEPSEFLTAYLGLHADVENLRAFARVKSRSTDGDQGDQGRELGAAFLAGGSLAAADMIAALPEPWTAVVDRFAKAPPHGVGNEVFREYLEQGTTAVVERRSFVRMERYGREMELRFLRHARYATFGYEPLVAFFLFHENELRNLRQLHAAKLAGVARETAQDLVAYVD
jgi:V/A-type H+-transporting ATPase subunit C